MEKTLGIDLGTNSIGLALKKENEFEWFGVYTFKKGVGQDKSGEFSFAAERTKHRSTRRLYNARRYRKWETLKVLIENDYCPLDLEDFNKWKHYIKGEGRKYPVENESFQKWIKLDFNGDGKPDYSSPYQLRRELIQVELDLGKKENRYKVGRAFYHIAQRRGFKSSRKHGVNDKTAVYKGSNETNTIGRNEYEDLLVECGTLGAAMAKLEDEGIRIRNRYTLRKDYKDEVERIISKQNITDNSFSERLLKAIFYQRPLRSQKGLVGKCTLEPNKHRCPISHPKYELYRAWSYINNIKFRNSDNEDWQQLPYEIKVSLLENVFMRLKSSFPFEDIRKHIQKQGNINWELNYKKKADKVSVAGCPVSARFKSVCGENWRALNKQIARKNKKGEEINRTYDIEDIWHILFSSEDEEFVEEFFLATLNLEEDQVKGLMNLWSNLPVGYANLSLKAINNILPFLQEGIIYTESVFLAKIPEIIGKETFDQNKEQILSALRTEIMQNRREKTIVDITNNLISKYYLLDYNERFGWKDTNYKLDQSDKRDIEYSCIEHYGEKRWNNSMEDDFKNTILKGVEEKYQSFFEDPKREHLKPPQLMKQICNWILGHFDYVSETQLLSLYHPSKIDIYPSKEDQKYLMSPKTAAFKNPMAYKTLHVLRRVINHLIETGRIDRETRIVVEIAREMNDTNKRWAIETYQRRRENENKEFAIAIAGLLKDKDFKGEVDPNSEKDKQKFRLWFDQLEDSEAILKEVNATKSDVDKYRLWKEQGCKCMYTGKTINLTDLFNTNKIDFEHTIPRSKSFDNSMENMTVCYADYNRNIKGNKIPTELPNYSVDTVEGTAIESRLEAWKKKVADLEKLVEDAKVRSKFAPDKEKKDSAIRQRHLYFFEYDYWKNKLDRFTREDIPAGFKKSQLVDTQIISKYAFHYLKTAFQKVDVQKGSVTAEFRKIYQIQPKEDKKDRTKHHHHAIDAAVLTLIPPAARRQEILKKAYEFNEKTGEQYHEKPFSNFSSNFINDIEKSILINNIPNKDQALSPGKKTVRKRGKVVWLKDSKGQPVKDSNGKKVPKITQGNSIRGQLHQQTFYGKIKAVQRDPNGKPLRDDDNQWILEKKNDGFKFVLRKPIELVTKLDQIVDPYIARMIEIQMDGRTLKQTIADGVWMLDQNSNKINKIRHVRCWVRSSNLLAVKKQTYLSKHDYKNYYYADTGDNYAFALYQDEYGSRKIMPRNLFDISNFDQLNSLSNKYDLFEKTILIGKGKNKTEANLYHIFQVGQKVLFYVENKEELMEIDSLTDRLYYVRLLFDAQQGLIQFQHHLEARSEEQLQNDFPKETFGAKGKYGFSKFSTKFIAPRLLLSPGNFDFIIENKDFEFTIDGEIKFKF